MLKTLQAKLLQYVNHELPDVQAGFRKGKGTRDQIANIRWIMEKAREFRKTSISAELFQTLKDDVKVLHSICLNLEDSAMATGLEKVSFHSNPKERKC